MKVVIPAVAVLLVFAGVCGAGEITGEIDIVNAERGYIKISGVKVNAKSAKIKNEADQFIDLSQLVAGDYVDVEGVFEGLAQVKAVAIKREFPKPAVDEIQGRVEEANHPRRVVTIGGIDVNISKKAWLVGRDGALIELERIYVKDYIEGKGKWAGQAQFTAEKIRKES